MIRIAHEGGVSSGVEKVVRVSRKGTGMDVEGPTAPSCLCVSREMPCDAYGLDHSRLPISHATERGTGRVRAMELKMWM